MGLDVLQYETHQKTKSFTALQGVLPNELRRSVKEAQKRQKTREIGQIEGPVGVTLTSTCGGR
jgi:hypothetical protein